MTTVEDVINKAKGLADAAGKKTEELVSLTKLKVESADTQKALSEQLEAVGRMVYAAYQRGEETREELLEPLQAIDALEQKAASILDKIDELRRTKHCSACGKNNAQDAAFCQNCGAKL